MKHQLIKDHGHRRLLLIFGGWGMDSASLGTLDAEGYDIMVAWDYTNGIDGFDISEISRYEEICVMAWSFGVAAASCFLDAYSSRLPITLTIAVNGTEHPVDDALGIPRAIFDGTLAGLNEATLMKFYRRMCGSSALTDKFLAHRPQRDIQSLKDELSAINAMGAAGIPHARWDKVYVSTADRIIPPGNQLNAWKSNADVVKVEGPHLPDFNAVISGSLINKPLVKRRFGRSVSTYDSAAAVQQQICRRLASLWLSHGQVEGLDIVEVGAGTGAFSRLYLEHGSPRSLRLWDIVEHDDEWEPFIKRETLDAEVAIMNLEPESVDAIVSASTVQWFNSLPSFLSHAQKALRPGGIVAFSTFGPETFARLRQLTGSTLRHASLEALKEMVPEGFEILEALTDPLIEPEFADVMEMMRHIKHTGVNGAVTSNGLGILHKVLRDYPVDTDGKVRLAYQPIYVILKKTV